MNDFQKDLHRAWNSTFEKVAHKIGDIPGSSILIRYIASSHQGDPLRSLLELFLLLFAIRYFLASKYSTSKTNYVKLTEEEVDELVSDWEPEPLVKPLSEEQRRTLNSVPVVVDHNGPIVQLQNEEGKEFINLTSTDIYGILQSTDIKQNAVKSIRKYGVGSCGPAGFYGHQDAHANCEAAVAKFLGTQGSILYSQGFATASSVIPCFLKRGDVIVADSKVNLGIQKGILLSRATVVWYKHNDMADLEKSLIKANKFHRKGPLPRRFIITEGIFETTGDSPHLPSIVQLKRAYKYRLLLDESYSLGVLGDTGRGLPEDQHVPRSEIEITLSNLCNAFGSSGGFCAGSRTMVEHQRITSLAYTFSATMPPYLANITNEVIDLFSDEHYRQEHFISLANKIKLFYTLIVKSSFLTVISRPDSPMVIIKPNHPSNDYNVDSAAYIQDIIDICRQKGILVTRLNHLAQHDLFEPEYAIKLFIAESLDESRLHHAANVVVQAFESRAKN